MKCPQCGNDTILEKVYKDNLCKNRQCSLYMKGDVSKFNKNLNRSSKTSQELINDIIQEFDFDKVLIVMRFIDWQWDACNGVPDIHQLKDAARKHLDDCITGGKHHQSDFYSSCGGFKATYSFDDNSLELQFVLEDWIAD